MNSEKVFLFDLVHTGRGYMSEFIPLGIGCIKAHLMEFSEFADSVEVRLFKNPQIAIDGFLRERPSIVGFSNYSWNFNLGVSIAREIKSIEPNTLIVFGGPNYPLEDVMRERWFRSNPAVDLYIIGDGEETFTRVYDEFRRLGNIERLKRMGLEGCQALVDGRLFNPSSAIPRTESLDKAPSPYLRGYFDEWLEDESFIPMLETTRGCPFTCTFCDKGSRIWAKIHRKSVARFEAELEYVAARYPGKLMCLADDNFGMYGQDIEYARAIQRVQKKHRYPYFIRSSTGKNRQDRILQVSEILQGSLQFTASVQSMDPEVLKNVRRENISYEVLIDSAKRALSNDATTRSEVILGLPGDTLAKHRQALFKLIDADIRCLLTYTLIFLEGTELATAEGRKKWNLESKYRINAGAMGSYRFGDKDLLSVEIEEVCVSSDSLPFEDYIRGRLFGLTVGIFYSDFFLYEFYQLLKNFDIPGSEVVERLDRRVEHFPPTLRDIFRQFDAATRGELWNSEEELRSHLTQSREVFHQILEGDEGRNLMFTYRGMALLSGMEEVVEEIKKVTTELLGERAPEWLASHGDYLEELKTYSLFRKGNVFDQNSKFKHRFHYDFESLYRRDFMGLPQRSPDGVEIEFFASLEQRKALATHGTDLLGIRKIFSRTDIGRLQRSMVFHYPGSLGYSIGEIGISAVDQVVVEPYQNR